MARCIPYFTFQSGSIQIICLQLSCSVHQIFTFQSGSIQMIAQLLDDEGDKTTLHSNLVLFKYYDNTVNLPYISTFTFQSGSIQISNHSFCNLFYRLLYIPIWFYSNDARFLITCFIPFFTFQSGSIQIIQGVGSYVAEIFPLHSNLVLFKFMRQPYTSA